MYVTILFVVYGNFDIISGGYLYDRRLAEFFSARGHTVRVITPDELTETSPPEAQVCIVDELCHPHFRTAREWNRLPDSAVRVAMVHHLASDEDLPLGKRIRHWNYERQFFQFPDYVIVNSRSTADSVRRKTPYRGEIGLAMPGRDSGDSREGKLHERRPFTQGKLELLFLGNVIPRKGLHHILTYLERFTPGELVLHVGGRLDADPEYAERMRTRVQNSGLKDIVHFHGFLEIETKDRLLNSAQLLVVPSSHEGFGIVYLEALGHGVVPVAGNKGGSGDIIRSGVNGFRINPHRPRQLHRIIESVRTSPETYSKLQQQAVKTWKNHPDWNETFRSVGETIEAMAAT